MVLFTAATNGHLAVKPRARTEHVAATVKTEAHTTSPCFGEALNVDVLNSRTFESAMQARLAQVPSRQQRLERAFDFQGGFSPKVERQPFFFDIVGGRSRDQYSQQQQHAYGGRGRDREEDAQEQNKRMRVQDADEVCTHRSGIISCSCSCGCVGRSSETRALVCSSFAVFIALLPFQLDLQTGSWAGLGGTSPSSAVCSELERVRSF